MNTQGWIRGTMAKNMEEEKFLEHVVDCLGREFEMESGISKEGGGYLIKLGGYESQIDADDLRKLQLQGAYCLDKHILAQLQSLGFEFDKYRSQYIRYVYGNFYRTEDGTVY